MGMIILAAQFDNYTPRKDRSVTLRFITGEMSPEQVKDLYSILDQFGYLAFKVEAMLTEKEKKAIDDMKVEFDGKSLSKRLMGKLFKYWKNKETGFNDFDQFYKYFMEKKIQEIEDSIL